MVNKWTNEYEDKQKQVVDGHSSSDWFIVCFDRGKACHNARCPIENNKI